MDKEQAKDKAANQDGGGRDGGKASRGGLWQYEVSPQDPGAGAQQSNSAHYTGGAHGGDSQQGDFLKSPLEANAMPAGAPQSSRGSAGKGGTDPQTAPVTGAAGGGGAGGAGEIASGGSIGAGGGAGGSGDAKASDAGDAGDAPGAGGGQPSPVGNGTRDQPVWAT